MNCALLYFFLLKYSEKINLDFTVISPTPFLSLLIILISTPSIDFQQIKLFYFLIKIRHNRFSDNVTFKYFAFKIF